jgi:phosphoserine aminotransferase
MQKPLRKPSVPNFSSGPCAKFPGWSLGSLTKALIGRSHRSLDGQAAIKYMLDKTRAVLEIPKDYKLALIAGSATGAITTAMWNFLGAIPVNVLAWDVFGRRWADDVNSLNVEATILEHTLGEANALTALNSDEDLLFVWNATSNGSSIGHLDWHTPGNGLTICDATSAAFCVKLPWEKLDITCFSWQKGIGSEGGHGLIALSPKALDRLASYTPRWAVPYIFNLKNKVGLRSELFEGVTINTPSMLCLEDYQQSLHWAETNGGLSFLVDRTHQNYRTIQEWHEKRSWVSPLIKNETFQSKSTSCLQIFNDGLPIDEEAILKIAQILSDEKVAYDINGFKGLPANLRIWTGPTIEKQNLEILLEWIDWAYIQHVQ